MSWCGEMAETVFMKVAGAVSWPGRVQASLGSSAPLLRQHPMGQFGQGRPLSRTLGEGGQTVKCLKRNSEWLRGAEKEGLEESREGPPVMEKMA